MRANTATQMKARRVFRAVALVGDDIAADLNHGNHEHDHDEGEQTERQQDVSATTRSGGLGVFIVGVTHARATMSWMIGMRSTNRAANSTNSHENGNPRQVRDRKGQVTTTTYDPLNRLTNMTVNNIQAAAYGYNAIGNMTSKSEKKALTLNYPASARLSPS